MKTLTKTLILLLLMGQTLWGDEKAMGLTASQIDEQVQAIGKVPPPWWATTKLRYPKTLKLNMQGIKGWHPSTDVRDYLQGVIYMNEKKYAEGTKLMHYLLKKNGKDPKLVQEIRNFLGNFYCDFHQDWLRSIYWYRQVDSLSVNSLVRLANCYYQLGNKELAIKELSKISTDYSRYGIAIKLWSDMGELDRALELGKASVSGNFLGATFAMADAYRKHNHYNKALKLYQSILDKEGQSSHHVFTRTLGMVKATVENIKLFETFSVNKIADGTYTAATNAYNNQLHVSATVKDGKITDVRVTQHKEKQFFSALEDTPAKIIRKQTVKGITATTGATITSEAIITATAKALAKGVKGGSK